MYDGPSADIATSDEAVGSPPLLNLPYELFLLLFLYLDAEDTLSLLCSCRSLYGHIRDEPIWREFCCRHGLRDVSIYSQPSFFVIYASLIHTYGPLIGLWASDHPFTGNIVEFRLVQEPGPYPFLLGEVWRFQSHVANYCDPKLPEYLEIVSIRPQWDEFGFPQPATLHWRRSLENPSFSLLAPTRLGTFLRYRDFYTNALCTVQHPDFPSSFALWYDSERPLPRLRQQPCEDYSNQGFDEDAEDGLLFIPTEDPTPPAIAFFPTSNEQFSLHNPHITFPDLRLMRLPHDDEMQPAPSRYYPLRFPPIQDHLYLDPGDVNWTRQSLDGLWIGANGAHDSEVLLVDSSDPDETIAWKITGTMHIPRGVTCWKFNPDHILPHNDVSPAMELGELPFNSRLFTGHGHICPEGFMYVFTSDWSVLGY